MYQPVERKFVFAQWFAGAGVMLLLVHVGLIGGWASPSTARLVAPDSDIPLTDSQAHMVASIANFSRVFGGILGAALTSLVGSKKSIFITGIPLAFGWLFIVLANRVDLLYASRLTSGFGLGMVLAVFPLYVGEIGMPEIRGALISLATVGAPIGQIIASVCGAYLSINMAGLIYLALAVLLLVLFFMLPESPHHLVKRGKIEEARRAINWYRGGQGVPAELELVEKFVATDGQKTFWQNLSELKTPWIRRATLQIVILFSFMQITGLNVIMFYAEWILTKAKFTYVEPSHLVIVANVMSMFATIASIFLIDWSGRKFLLVVSSFGCMLAMLGLMYHFMIMDETNHQWLSGGSILLFMFAFFIGLMPAPCAILSEIFPANVKSIASCIAMAVGASESFVSAATFIHLTEIMGDANVYMIYAVASFLVIPYTLLFVHETKGKNLQQIQEELMD